ncbi:MAG: methylmalonyl Co-A mutase-associated GTPase MeaB [bacterium]
MNNNSITEELLRGNRRALAKSISLVENEDAQAAEILDAVYSKIGRAYRIGITGPPGAGKSTLVDALTKHYRKQGKTVGIIAVDPTSPFTGGALLGDRVRMTDLSLDDGVFIRSMATRGSLGGLARNAGDAADILDAFGKDYVILETVGVGQSELDVVEAADSTVVVLVPESGDAVQAMKAGLMEIADLFVINKADLAGSSRAFQEIQAMLQLRESSDWHPEVLKSVASTGEGIETIAAAIAKHRNYLEEKNILEKNRKSRLVKKIYSIVRFRLEKAFWDETTQQILHKNIEGVQHLQASPYEIAEQLLVDFKRKLEKNYE